MPDPLPIARNSDGELALLPALANRHGLITGATGTGKTVTLQVMAERFSGIGTPVFMADVKGDLAGISQAGVASDKLAARLKAVGFEQPRFAACPVVLWDVFGEQGHPVRAARARAAGCGKVHRRADAERRRPAANERRQGCGQYPRRRQAHEFTEALFDHALVAPVRAVRTAAGDRRSGQAEARFLLRRGASPLQRCAEAAAGQ